MPKQGELLVLPPDEDTSDFLFSKPDPNLRNTQKASPVQETYTAMKGGIVARNIGTLNQYNYRLPAQSEDTEE